MDRGEVSAKQVDAILKDVTKQFAEATGFSDVVVDPEREKRNNMAAKATWHGVLDSVDGLQTEEEQAHGRFLAYNSDSVKGMLLALTPYELKVMLTVSVTGELKKAMNTDTTNYYDASFNHARMAEMELVGYANGQRRGQGACLDEAARQLARAQAAATYSHELHLLRRESTAASSFEPSWAVPQQPNDEGNVMDLTKDEIDEIFEELVGGWQLGACDERAFEES
jgi:hypothetical protein